MVAWLINGQSPASLGVEAASRSLVSRGISRVILRIKNAALAEAAGFTYRQAVTITRDGATWFQGRVARRPRFGNGGGVGSGIEIWDAWWDLSLLTYEQQWAEAGPPTTRVMLGAEATEEATDNGGIQVGPSTWVKYGYGAEDGDRQTTAQELARLVGFAGQRGVSIQLGDVPTGFYIWPEESQDRKVSELMETLLRWHPFVVTWFDYTTTPPTLHIRSRLDESEALQLTTASIDLATVAGSVVSCNSRDDLVPASVVIRYEQRYEGEAATVYEDKYPPEATGRELGALLATISLDEGQAWDVSDVSGGTEPPEGWPLATIPAGMAQRYVEHYTLTHDGELELVDDDAGGVVWMGKALNLLNGQTGWATMRAPVQSVTEDLRMGRTSLMFGSSEVLGLEETLDRLLRCMEPVTRGGRDTPPGDPTPEPPEPPPTGGPLEGYFDNVSVPGTPLMKTGVGLISDTSSEEEYEVGDLAGVGIAANGVPLYRYLFIDWEPDVEEFSFIDEAGEVFHEYKPLSTGRIVGTPELVASAGANGAPTAPEVDPESGSVTTNGRFYFLLWKAVWTFGETAPDISQYRGGSFALHFIPPGRLELVPTG